MKQKIIVIVGPTASGKTSLSIDIAKEFNGEIISADSRQVYRGMDLGSGKVTKEEMDGVPHHLLDVANPIDVYTASDFDRDATAALDSVLKKQHLPIVAGGSFFYVDTLLGRISTPEVGPNHELRSALEHKSAEELHTLLESQDQERAATIDKDNPRRLVRALEIVDALGKVPTTKAEEKYDTLTLGIDITQEELHRNIHTRLLERLEEGMVAEVERLLRNGVTHERLESLGLEYRYISRHLRNELPYYEMVTELETKIRQFAKRQRTWLKRDESIVWVDRKNREAIFAHVREFLG